MDGPPVEQDQIYARALAEEFSKMSRNRAVGGIGKPPFPQRRLCAVRPRRRVTHWKESVEYHALDFRPRQRRGLRSGDHP